MSGARAAVARLVTCGLVLVLSGAVAASARAGGPSEEQVKAAYLFNFARFVEWPGSSFPSPGAPIRIAVLGDEGFARLLEETIGDKRVGERPVSVELHAELQEALLSHILFVPRDRDTMLGDVLEAVKGHPIFTVASNESFAARGGMANFYRVANKVRFAINEQVVRSAGLKISSRLLRLAKVVECCEGVAKADWR